MTTTNPQSLINTCICSSNSMATYMSRDPLQCMFCPQRMVHAWMGDTSSISEMEDCHPSLNSCLVLHATLLGRVERWVMCHPSKHAPSLWCTTRTTEDPNSTYTNEEGKTNGMSSILLLTTEHLTPMPDPKASNCSAI